MAKAMRLRRGLRARRLMPVGMVAFLLVACAPSTPRQPEPEQADPRFPPADRPIAPIVSSRFSTEEARDRVSEADEVMRRAGIRPGMTVADIGAGEGYYTIRLAARVGAQGRVLAQDIVPATRDRLAERVNREQLDNVSVKLGAPADPKLPENSFDRIFLVHMYHEITAPYEFLWRMRTALRSGGQVIVVDANRPTDQHGTPPLLLNCEFTAVGYRLVDRQSLPRIGAYLAVYEARGPRPEPEQIRGCAIN